MKLWQCKKCGEQWIVGPNIKGAPRRCYQTKPYPEDLEFCGGTEFELVAEDPDLNWQQAYDNGVPATAYLKSKNDKPS